MSDEVREVEIRIQANQAIRELGRVAVSMDNVGNLAGRSDADLRRVERRMDSWAASTRQANATIVAMKAALAASKAETNAAERAATKMATTMERSAAAHDKTKAALLTATAAMKQMRAENVKLRTENEALVKKIERLDEALTGTRQEFDAYKASINAADKGLLRFGASATQTLTRLESLEQQMNAMNGKSLSMLNLPTALAGNNAAAFARNPQTNAIQNMSTGNLAQISQAYAMQSRTLQQTVERELQARFARMSSDQLEFSNALRYQMYDLVGVFGTVGVALTGLSVAFLNAGIAWEKNFANVVRTSQTTGQAVEQLRREFLDLQSVIPVSSEDLATIGTLGAQMGVSAANLSYFTQIVAKFSATAGTSVDESATALSRLDELLPDVEGNYNRLASAILKTGVNAVATEQQIVRGTGQIASMGQIAGMTTPEVVALASAMSSLGFSPELQRSIITSSFSKILSATTQVTEKTEKFGEVLGMTGKQFQEAWRSDALGTYRDLLEAIANRSDAVSVLQDLGLASQRLTPNLLKLGQNVNVLDDAFKDTKAGWREQTELSRQYGVISQTVAARIQVLGQAWEAFLVSLNESEGIIGPIVDGLTEVVRVMTRLARTPGVSNIVTLAAVLGTIVGVAAIGASALALLTAGYIAMVNATSGLRTAVALQTASQEQNTVATTRGATAKWAITGATAAHTTATNTNTAALGGQTAMLAKGGQGILNMSSNMLTALPRILSWATGIGIAAAAVAGMVVLFQESRRMAYDMEKTIRSIDTPKENIDYGLEKIKAAEEGIRRVMAAQRQAEVNAGDRKSPFGDIGWGERFKDVNLTNPFREMQKTAYEDIEETILALGSLEEQYAAINEVSDRTGMSQEQLVRLMPGLAAALGTGVAAAAKLQEEMVELEEASVAWVAALGTTEDGMDLLKESLQSGAEEFFDFSQQIKKAWEDAKLVLDDGTMVDNPDFDPAAAWKGFTEGLDTQITEYEEFLAGLTDITTRGGVNVAAAFAEIGPSSMGALAEAMKMSDEDLQKIEDQMSLAAFYASEAFAGAFAQNNAILAQVFERSGRNPEAVAAVNTALNEAVKAGGVINPETLAGLEAQFGFSVDLDMIPQIDPEVMELARLTASATPLTLTTLIKGPNGEPVYESLDVWRIEEEGKILDLTVDPNTAEGQALIAAWRAEEARKPISLKTTANLSNISEQLRQFRINNGSLYVDVRPRFNGQTSGGGLLALVRKDGGSIDGLGKHIPAFATGGMYGQFKGPGTGTSDSLLARVSNGEYIHTARAVRYYGKDFFDDLNRMRIPRFATGGMIGGAPAAGGAGTVVNATVIQNYPTTQDPIRKLKEDAESVIAGIWT